MHSFTFNGINSRDYCELFVSGGGTFNAPERDIESVSVPGRNGELTVDNGRYKNISVEYPAWIAHDFARNAAKARAWLTSQKGYKRLEDDYAPQEYRMARFVNGLEFSTIAGHVAGATTIKFDCMPQRFLKSGEETVLFSLPSGVIINPTMFDSEPIITVSGSGSGSLTINGSAITLSDIVDYVVLNSEIKRAYKDLTPKDDTMVGTFPIFIPGENTISFSGNITGLSVVPRWWTL